MATRPAVLPQVVGTAGEVKSHRATARVLEWVGELSLSGRPIHRLTEEIGAELAAKRDQATEDYVPHRREPPLEPAPEVASISLDGGRLWTRASGQGVGVQEPQGKEDQGACLWTLKGETFAEDPHPEPPKCFLDAPTVDPRVRDRQAHHGPRPENERPPRAELRLGQEAVVFSSPSAAAADARPEKPAWPPPRTAARRTRGAPMRASAAFGKRAAAEAERRHFQGAPRGARWGDGGAWIWTLHATWFSWRTAIADFVHPWTYL